MKRRYYPHNEMQIIDFDTLNHKNKEEIILTLRAYYVICINQKIQLEKKNYHIRNLKMRIKRVIKILEFIEKHDETNKIQ